MTRVKVITDPSDLVIIFRALDTPVKMKVFQDLTVGWKTLKDIIKLYGKEGKSALLYLEKIKLVETRWQQNEKGTPEKVYRSYYSSFNLNFTCSVKDISEILYVAGLSNSKFLQLEKKIYNLVTDQGKFIGDISEQLTIPVSLLKCLVKRSSKLEYRAHTIERLKE